MHHASFFGQRSGSARAPAFRPDRCGETRRATRAGWSACVGGSSGHTAPRFMGRTALDGAPRFGTMRLPAARRQLDADASDMFDDARADLAEALAGGREVGIGQWAGR